MYFKTLAVSYCAVSIAVGIALAADPNPPTVISPTSTPYALANGIAPNGIVASSSAGVLFGQPFTDGKQPRGVYSITIPGGAVSSLSTLPAVAPPLTAENSVAIVPSPAGSGFTPGNKYATSDSPTNSANDAVFNISSGSPVLFIDGIAVPPVSDNANAQHQIDISFDAVGTFQGALIVTADDTISLYNSTPTLIASYKGPHNFVLQGSVVAPLSYAACPGCIFVTAMPTGDVDNPTPTGNGEILTVSPGALSGSAAVLFATTTGIPKPESIQFVTPASQSCTIGDFTYFASGYATGGQINTPLPTNGAILAWTPAQLSLAGAVGHYLVQDEEITGGGIGAIYIDAGLATQKLFSDTTGTGNTGYQVEDTTIVQCKPATGCPATQGFWHKAEHWPTVSGTVDGVTWNASTKLLTIGTGAGAETYTQAQILQLLPSGSLHTGGVENDLSQFIAAALNLIAGAQHTATIDGIIATIVADLSGHNLFSPPPLTIPTQAATDLAKFGDALDAYNSAKGLGCSEGSGLSKGSGT
jgi:hypothetical protein